MKFPKTFNLLFFYLDLKFALTVVTPFQRYVSTKLEVSSAFLFRVNWTHWKSAGQTESVQCGLLVRVT